MTFDEQERSHESGKPVCLFFIRYGEGANNFYAYTDCEEAIVYGGKTYTPQTIQHAGIKQSGTLDNAQSSFTTPYNNELALKFRDWPPSEVISLTIRQGHADNGEFPVIWSGRILSAKLNEKEEAVYALERINTSMLRAGLRRKYGEICPHLLYSQGEGLCNADREAASFEFTAASVDKAIITLDATWIARDDKEKFVSGTVWWITADGRREVRQIVALRGANKLFVGGPAIDLVGGMTVTATWGCNHLLDDCTNLHHNSQNYGGQWLIPKENPIGVKNIF